MTQISTADLKTIITEPDGAPKLVEWANTLGRDLAKLGLNTNQIRALFGEVRLIQAQWSIQGQEQKARHRLYLLLPKMAYRAKKEGEKVRALVNVLDPAVKMVLDVPDISAQKVHFDRFTEFFEAILAYHRAEGGK